MKMNQDKAWLLRKAEQEDNGFVSVGGLISRLPGQEAEEVSPPLRKRALGRFVELSRRSLQLTVEELARRADIDVAELLEIEEGNVALPEPRTVHKLSQVLRVAQDKLMILSGLAHPRDVRFDKAVVRFAARSEPMSVLSREEQEALQEFVEALADS